MEISTGMIIIGSLIWETTPQRIAWRNQLDLSRNIIVPMPVCYGRKSDGENRHGTFTMIFSNRLRNSKSLGRAIVVPYKTATTTDKQFRKQLEDASLAEGIDNTGARIFKSWGTVCIAVNPFIEDIKKTYIRNQWETLVLQNRNNLTPNQGQPDLGEYAVPGEEPSFDQNLYLQVGLEELFQTSLSEFDMLIATSNAIKLNAGGEIRYPTIKQIAWELHRSKYLDYILMNRFNGITTFQDKKILRTLRRRFKMNLAKMRTDIMPKYLV